MPSCDTYEELLQQYLDKALDSAQTAVLMSHLEVCSRCRLDFKLYQKVVQGLEQLEDLAPPGRLTSDVMANLDGAMTDRAGLAFADLPRHSVAPPWMWGASAAAAAAVVTVAAFLIFRAGSPVAIPVPEMLAMQDQPRATALQSPAVEEASPAVRASGQRILLTVSGGEAQLQRVNNSRWEQVAATTDVGYGDKIRTMAGATARIEYTSDKTTLKLRPNALVQILTNAVRVFHGDTWIRVDKIGSHFQAETPNAVASVRGTRYSAEVRYPQKIARLYEGNLDEATVARKFVQEYTKNMSDSRLNGLLPMLAYPMHATPVSLAVQVNMLIDSANAAREAQTNVQVFESKVQVASIDPTSNQEVGTVLVKEGFQTAVKNMQLAKLTTIGEDDFLKWNMPANTALLGRVRAEVITPDSGAIGGAPKVQPNIAPQSEPQSEAGDRTSPAYDGVERK